MRKIISKEEIAKKEKRSRRLIGISLLAIMVLSVFGIVIDSIGQTNNPNSKISYRGIEFINQGDKWIFNVNNINYFIINSPENLSKIDIGKINYSESYVGEPLYIYTEDQLVGYNLALNMNNIVERIQPACLNKNKCAGDYPLKTCEEKFIIIEESNETAITQEQNCVKITGKKEELQELTDIFILKILRIG